MLKKPNFYIFQETFWEVIILKEKLFTIIYSKRYFCPKSALLASISSAVQNFTHLWMGQLPINPRLNNAPTTRILGLPKLLLNQIQCNDGNRNEINQKKRSWIQLKYPALYTMYCCLLYKYHVCQLFLNNMQIAVHNVLYYVSTRRN